MVETNTKNVVSIAVEKFTVEKTTKAKELKEGVTLTGFALPFDKTSRNGFSYRKESVVKAAKSMEGRPMFFNHDIESLPIGKVEKINVTDKGLEYSAKLKPVTEQGVNVVEAVKAGLIENVSIQCMYENAEYNEKEDTFAVDVKEFLELSVVTIPGFAETTAQAHESLMEAKKMEEKKKQLKEKLAKEQAPVKVDEETESTSEESTSTEQDELTLEGLASMVQDFISQHDTTHSELDSRVAALQASFDAMAEEGDSNDDEESEESEDESEVEEDDESEEKLSDTEENSESEEPKQEESVKRSTVAPSSMEADTENIFNGAEYAKKRFGLN